MNAAAMTNKTRISFWSKLTFGWMTEDIRVGNTKPLEYEDIKRPYLQEDTKDIHEKYNKNWKLELQNIEGKSPNILRIILRSTSNKYMLSILVYLVLFTACRILLPVMLNFVLEELSLSSIAESSAGSGPNNGSKLDTGSELDTGSKSDTGSMKSMWLYLYMGGLLFIAIIQPFIKAQYYYRTTIMSSYFCSGLTGLVYDKVRQSYVRAFTDTEPAFLSVCVFSPVSAMGLWVQ